MTRPIPALALAVFLLPGVADAQNLVYFQCIDPVTFVTALVGDPALAAGSGFGASGTADLAAGTVSLFATATAPTPWAQGYAGFDRGMNGSEPGFATLQLINAGPAFSLPGMTFHFDGTYSFGGAPNARPNVHSYALLGVRIGTLIATASQDHIVFATYDAAGNLSNTSQSLTPGTSGGATISVISATPSGISEDFIIPAFTWPAGAPLTLNLRTFCTATSGNGSATADFSHTGRIGLALPAGVTLTSNAPVALNWVTNTLAVEGGPGSPADFAAPWPNPASDGVNLALTLPREGRVTVAAYDPGGRRVASVLDEILPAGRTQRTWRPSGLANGLYLMRADVDGRSVTRRIAWLGGVPGGR